MRVTNSLLLNNLLYNVNRNDRRLEEYQNQLATGKRLRAPSDDPVGVVKALKLRASLMELDRYQKNVEDGTDWLAATDSALDKLGKLMDRAKTLALEGSSTAIPPESFEAMAAEVAQLLDEAVQVGNTTLGSRYIFGGQKTTTQPMSTVGSPPTAVTYDGDAGMIQREIAPGIKIQVNVTGDQVMTGPGQVYETLMSLRDDLTSQNTSDISASRLGEIDGCIDEILSCRAEVGAKISRMETTGDKMLEEKVRYTELLSNEEDADIVEVLTKLQLVDQANQVALASGARLVRPTLLDFLS